jgi:hypothetical protein
LMSLHGETEPVAPANSAEPARVAPPAKAVKKAKGR